MSVRALLVACIDFLNTCPMNKQLRVLLLP
jgi:hypothetical protein